MVLSQFPCPIEKAQEVLGKKWSILIIRDIYAGKHRFSEIMNVNPTLSTRMLALRLKVLEENKFITKIITRKSPVRTEYNLTEKGKDTRRILLELSKFSLKYHPDFEMNENEKLSFENSLNEYFY